MRFICTGDLHLGSKRRRKNMNEVYQGDLEVLNQICKVVNEEEFKCLIIVGDLFDSMDVEQIFVDSTLKKFKSLSPTKVFIVPGNHDSFTENSYQHSFVDDNIHFLNGWEKYQVCEDVFLYGGSFERGLDEVLYLCKKWQVENTNAINIVAVHSAIKELTSRDSEKEKILSSEDLVKLNADLVLLGHDHNPRSLM